MDYLFTEQKKWFAACRAEAVPGNGGVCVKLGEEQVALFHFARKNEWYATQNQCPHRMQMALSRGLIGCQDGEPKVACPFHKRTFSLVDGRCMNSDECDSLKTYEVEVRNGIVYICVPVETGEMMKLVDA